MKDCTNCLGKDNWAGEKDCYTCKNFDQWQPAKEENEDYCNSFSSSIGMVREIDLGK